MSSTNQVKNSLILANADGSLPDHATWRRVRTTNEGLSWSKTVSPSTEIQPSRNVQDMVDIGAQGGGTIAAELHTPTADTDANIFLASLMCSTWSGIVVKSPDGVTLSVDATGALAISVSPFPTGTIMFIDGITPGINGPWVLGAGANGGASGKRPAGFTPPNFSYPVGTRPLPIDATIESIGNVLGNNIAVAPITGGATVDFGASPPVKVGDWFSLQNTAQSGNAGFYRVATLSGNVATCSVAPASVAAESGTAGVYLFIGRSIKNGTQPQWFNFNSVNYDDNKNALAKVKTGVRTGQSAFSFDANNIASVTHTLMYMNETASNSDPNTNDITITSPALSSRANVVMVSLAGSPLSGMAAAKTLSVTVNNNVRAQTGLGSYGLVGIGDGTFTVTGNMSSYFRTQGVYQQYLSGAYIPLHWGIGKNGGYLFFSLPKCKITSASNSAKGLNQDLTDDIAFQAMQADDGEYTMQMAYFPWAGPV